MPTDLPTGTVTFLFTDIEGSTRLLRELGPDRYADALAEHRRMLRSAFGAEGGVEVDTQGDAFFVAFPTAAGAVAAARAGQEGLAAGSITVRMGLHTGAPTTTAEGYAGIDVHRGARIAALAHGGQVVLSAATAALLENELLLELGRHRLKDFDAPAQLFQLGGAAFPPLRTPGAVELPTPATHFLGRERELVEAATLWLDRDPRVLTIVGPGGTGKTRFSIELARFLAEDADAGTVFVALAPVREPSLIVPLIAGYLGAAGDTAAAISTRIGEKRAHVVLDNLEQLLPDAAQLVAGLLAAAPALRIVATSREPLRIAGEAQFDLPPMVETEAVTLFLERAQSIRSDVADSPAVHELIRRLDGLPLAIELAAARVKLLDADEQQLFARLAIFRGGCTLEAVEAVCRADLDTLASLLDKSLVRRRTDTDGEERFWMLETIREFASERLRSSGEEDSLRREQADRLIELADRAGTRAVVDSYSSWKFDLVAPEIDNVRAVLDWALEHDPECGLRLATWLEAYWIVRDPVEGATWLERLLARAPDVGPSLRAQALRALGGTLDIFGEFERAAPCYRESLALFTAAGQEIDAAHNRFRIAANMVNRGEKDPAWPLLEESLHESRRLGIRVAESQALGFLVVKAQEEGDLAGAVELALESAAIAAEAGWAWWESNQLAMAGELERERGNLGAAESLALRSLELSLGLGDRQSIVYLGAELAIIAAERGDAERAGHLWGAVENEQSAGPVGQWERERAKAEALVLRVDGREFDQARETGRLLSIPEAAGVWPVQAG